MDILQQSLQAADILSGDDSGDIFSELGFTFNNGTESTEFSNELEELVSQADSLYSSGGSVASQSANNQLTDYNSSNTSFSNSSQQFDTSQFLNTSASINVNVSSANGQQQSYSVVSQSDSSHLSAVYSQSNLVSSEYDYRAHSENQTSNQTLQPALQTSLITASLSSPPLQTSTYTPASSIQPSIECVTRSLTTVSIAQGYAVATCNSVFSRMPTETVSSTARTPLTSSTDINQNILPPGIRIVSQPVTNMSEENQVVQNVLPAAVKASPGIQIIQQPNSENSQNTRQLISLLQKPIIHAAPASSSQATAQLINGLTVQTTNALNQNRNVALVRVAAGKHINIGDPQVVKALTANLVQKQQMDMQTNQQPQQQFIKLGQNNSFINVSSRPSQQAVLQKAQHITLQNGQTILLNNGQQVQLCTPQSQQAQVQISQQSSTQSSSISNAQQSVRNAQIPLTRLQIASVNIPIATSIGSTSTNNTFITLPVQTKQDPTTDTVTLTTSTDTSTVTQVATVPAKNIVQVQNSVEANSNYQKQNHTSVTSYTTATSSHQNLNLVTDQSQNANAQVVSNTANVQRAQLGPTLRLNLTPQQASQLTTAQLQTILKQHQATLQARALANTNRVANDVKSENYQQAQNAPSPTQKPIQNAVSSSSSLANILRASQTSNSLVAPVGNSVVVNKPATSDQTAGVQTFRIDPTLTEEQADEVKRLLMNRTIGNKIGSLSREQQQLVFAFRAQIRTMSPPVQQYYLRNPQLFMQKVLQKIRLGKPFILQVKTDTQQNKSQVLVSTVTNQNKPLHPTISLTQDPSRVKRVGSPLQVPLGRAKSPVVRAASPVVMKPNASPMVTQLMAVEKKAVKRPAAPEPPQTVSLVLEQLECHKKLVTHTDCTNAFKSVRDAIRRLVPFHTCNIPNVKEEHFDKSEKIFDKIADRIAVRTKAMVNKYHLLCLRDSTRDSCSAEMVMIERMFLQKEKAKLAEDKARIKENPEAIKDFFPDRRFSGEEETVEINSGDEENVTQRHSSMDSSKPSAIFDLSFDGTNSPHLMKTSMDSPLSSIGTPPQSRTSRHSVESSSSQRSFSSSRDTENMQVDSKDGSAEEEILLQEAVDSILL